MSSYPTLTDIEIEWEKSRSGVCIIVEGQTALDDPWFYNHWFGGQARRFTFFPQDGWEKVRDAVAALRLQIGEKSVYGIVDRDFEPVAQVNPFPADGNLRTRKYTLENYLLNPRCWYEYLLPHSARNPKPNWDSVEKVSSNLERLYQECLSLSAFNWVLRQARQMDYGLFQSIPEKDRRYREHPKAFEKIDAPTCLRNIQQQAVFNENLVDLYHERLSNLQAMAFSDWEELVSGKYVLKLFREHFPIKLSGDQAWDDVLGAYMVLHNDPPDDLVELLQAIQQDSLS